MMLIDGDDSGKKCIPSLSSIAEQAKTSLRGPLLRTT